MSGEDGTVDQSRESPEVDQSEESHVVGGPPVTGEHGVDRIISDLGVLDVTDGGLKLVELAPDVTEDELRQKTGVSVA